MIIVNLDPWGLHAGAFRCDYRFVSDVQEVKNEPNIVMPWHVRMPGFRFYGELRKNLAMGIRSDISSKVMDRGAVLSKIVRSERDWDYIMQNLEMKSFAVDAETKIMLRDVLLENENREVVFVVAPIVDAWWEKFAAKAEFEELKSWIRNFKHAHVIDWRELGDRYDLSCYFDPTHLNEKGARAFTKALKSSLMSRGLLKKECSQ